MSAPKTTGKQRCPWCQHLIPRKVAFVHRCPAKPQTYFPEDPRSVSLRKPRC